MAGSESGQGEQFEVAVIGAGPAGLFAALRAARLGARTALITRDGVGGMAAADGPVPVRVLTQAARLRREARQLGVFGIEAGETALDYGRLMGRVREVVAEVSRTSTMRPELEKEGVTIFEHAGTVRFVDPHTVEADSGLRLEAEKIILCVGGTNRLLPLPGANLLGSHHHAWSMTAVPESLLVIGAGATGVQVASVFNELGSHVKLYEAGPRILSTEDQDVSRVMAESFREAGIDVREDFGRILEFQRTDTGIRMSFASENGTESVKPVSLWVPSVGRPTPRDSTCRPPESKPRPGATSPSTRNSAPTSHTSLLPAMSLESSCWCPKPCRAAFRQLRTPRAARSPSRPQSALSAASPTLNMPKPDSAKRWLGKITTSWSPERPSR